MESSNAKSFFGVPISQVQSSNYAYVPATNSSNSIEEQSSPSFVLDPQQLPKLSTDVTKRIGEIQTPEIQTNFSTIQQLPTMELNLQSNINLTETSIGIPLQQNFQLVTQQTKDFSEIVQNSSYHSEELEKGLAFGEASVIREDFKFVVKSEENSADIHSDETSGIPQIKKIVNDFKDGSLVWKAVKDKVLSNCRLWDILVDKANHDYISETMRLKLSQDKHRKFKHVVKEMEDLLGEFKCFMDGCVEENKENIPTQFSLGPELCRAYEIVPSKYWTLKDESAIDSFYRPFFENLNLDFSYGPDCVIEEEEKFGEASDANDNNYSEQEDQFEGHDVTKFYNCNKCGKSYSRRPNLVKHQEKCNFSQQQIRSTSLCKWYERSSENGVIICQLNGCQNTEHISMLAFWGHFRDEHALPEDFTVQCSDCPARFLHTDLLSDHCKSEHVNQNETFNTINPAKKRKISAAKKEPSKQDKDLQYKCDICDFSTSAQNGLSLHKRRLHKLDKNNEAVTQLDNPDFHNRDPKKYRHQCLRCTRRYKKIHHLERHQNKCDGIPPPTFKPMWEKDANGRFICGVPGCSSEKSWTSSFSVWHHFNSEHADMQDDSYCVWKCDLCDKKFPNKSMLTRHRTHKHEALFRFECSKCLKRLASNKLLKLHMTQHTGEKPFSCDFCDYKAITQSVVNQHKMRMHEGSMPDKVLPKHVCEICGKSFKVRSNLKEHMASHSDDKKFLCGMCGKSLKNRQCLNRHLFTHGVKKTCQICNKNFATSASLSIHQRDKHGLSS